MVDADTKAEYGITLMHKTAVVTGAGSGVGRAVALALAGDEWQVALVGRRESALRETIVLAGSNGTRMLACPADIAKTEDVKTVAFMVLRKWGAIEALVNAAGTNVPRRGLRELSLEDYHRIVDTNLTGAYLCAQAFLPSMRLQKSGTIVNIVSDAGKLANVKAGPAYVVSKFGLTGLTQSLNLEERANGIRACAIFPGDINTPIVDLRPTPPSSEARLQMLQPQDVAECVLLAIRLPPRAIIEELMVRPR